MKVCFLACVLLLACARISIIAQIYVLPQTISTNVTLSGFNLVRGTVLVDSNAVLRIKPGTKMQMESGAEILIRGRIEANGTEALPIEFTRASSGARWKGIRFVRAQPSRFAHCMFEYADCGGTHLDYYDDDCNPSTAPPRRLYHEAIVAVNSSVQFESCLFQNLFDGSRPEGDAVAIISDDPEFPGAASAHFNNCRFISIGQGIHSRFSYLLVENCFFTGHDGDNDDIDMYGESDPVPLIRNNVFLNARHDDMINPTRCSAVIVGNVISGGDDHGIVLRDKCAPIVMNNFISNIASGGISVQNQCEALILNNTIVDCGRGIRLFDHTSRWGAPYCLSPGSGRATVINTIIADTPVSLALEESTFAADRGSHVTIVASNAEGGRASAQVSASSTLLWDASNSSIDPELNGEFGLLPGSPMIDAGTNMLAGLTNLPTEVTATIRVLDGNGDGMARPDIGGDEFLLPSADSNGDGIPDGWTAQFGLNPSAVDIAASNPDKDLHSTFQEWLADTNPTNTLSHLRLELSASGMLGFESSRSCLRHRIEHE